MKKTSKVYKTLVLHLLYMRHLAAESKTSPSDFSGTGSGSSILLEMSLEPLIFLCIWFSSNVLVEKTPEGNVIYNFTTDPVAVIEPAKGEDVTLTIDTAIQHICEKMHTSNSYRCV